MTSRWFTLTDGLDAEAAQPGADRPGLRQLRPAGAASTGGDGA
jgi:hypothetical protein